MHAVLWVSVGNCYGTRIGRAFAITTKSRWETADDLDGLAFISEIKSDPEGRLVFE